MEKLFVVVRNDLDPGLQLAQAVHAAVKYALFHEDARRWHVESNNVAVLQVPDEAALKALTQKVLIKDPGCLVATFEEPDLDHQWTAAAFGGGAKKLMGSLPLALRGHLQCCHAGVGVLEDGGNLQQVVSLDARKVDELEVVVADA